MGEERLRAVDVRWIKGGLFILEKAGKDGVAVSIHFSLLVTLPVVRS